MADGVMTVAQWLMECSDAFDTLAADLDALDAQLGDADHGTNMSRGFAAARTLDLDRLDSAGDALRHVGMALVQNVGGASGPLFGTFFLRAGALWPRELSTAGLARAVREGVRGVQLRGKAEPGDKTMVDALAAAARSLGESAQAGEGLAEALSTAAAAAEAGRDATVDMIARRGRAALKAANSVGVKDPGAVSSALIVRSAIRHIGR